MTCDYWIAIGKYNNLAKHQKMLKITKRCDFRGFLTDWHTSASSDSQTVKSAWILPHLDNKGRIFRFRLIWLIRMVYPYHSQSENKFSDAQRVYIFQFRQRKNLCFHLLPIFSHSPISSAESLQFHRNKRYEEIHPFRRKRTDFQSDCIWLYLWRFALILKVCTSHYIKASYTNVDLKSVNKWFYNDFFTKMSNAEATIEIQ